MTTTKAIACVLIVLCVTHARLHGQSAAQIQVISGRDPGGPCAPSQSIPSPPLQFNVQTGNYFSCTGTPPNLLWTQVTVGAGTLKGDGHGGSTLITGTASDCTHVDGSSAACGGGGGAPTGPAGGALSGTYPNPGVLGFTAGAGTLTGPATNGVALISGGPGGTPSSLTLTNATGLPVAGGGSGLATVTANAILKGNGTSPMIVSGCTIDSSNNLSCPGNITSGQGTSATGAFDLSGSTSGTVTQTVNNVAGTWTLTWPASAGSNGQFLKTNGSGVSSWADAATGVANYQTSTTFTGIGPSAFTPTHTLDIYDATASTGATFVKVRMGAGNANGDFLQEFLDSAGAQINGGSGFQYLAGNGIGLTFTRFTEPFVTGNTLDKNGVWIAGTTSFGSNSGAGTSTPDINFIRGAAGQWDVGTSSASSCATISNCRDIKKRFMIDTVATIASTTTIAPATRLIHVTGTAAIDTITAPTNFGETSSGGCIVLIPDGVFTTTTGGNIALASTAVVNKALHECFDNGTSKWYPSY